MEKENEILEQYIEDLKNIPFERGGEKSELIGKLLAGDTSVGGRLGELYLMKAMQIATEYRGQGVALIDLIQESSMAVMLAIADVDCDVAAFADSAVFDSHVERCVKAHIKAVVEAEQTEKKSEDEIAERINLLSDTAQMLAERLGREATLEELREYTKLTEDEIKILMKMSLDAL